MENVLKIVLSIGLIGRSLGEVSQSPSFDWDSYSNVEHVPAAVYGPPQPSPPSPPTTPFPANEYGAPPIPTATFELAQGNLEYSGQVIEVHEPEHHHHHHYPTFTHFLPSEQIGELKKPTVSFQHMKKHINQPSRKSLHWLKFVSQMIENKVNLK